MAVPKYKLTGLKWGVVSITPPVVSAQNVGTGTVEVVGLETTDKILILLQGTAQKEAIPVAAQCATNNVLTIQFANITSGTAATTAKSILWLATKE
jgi:antitoxin component of RelBE/YafQ-DinJ toxin-antitoxin module